MMPDVNVLIYAHRTTSSEHHAYARWLSDLATGNEPFALSEVACHGFIRIATNVGAFKDPSTLAQAVGFIEALRRQPLCRMVRPGPRHWDIFVQLCETAHAVGKLVADAYHAAVAIEHGCEWVTTDHDFGRFPGLRLRHPLRPEG